MNPWTQPGGRGRSLKAVLQEGLVVACLGLGFALAANQLSPRGLSLTKNYSPAGIAPVVPAVKSGSDNGTNGGTNLMDAESVLGELKANGLQVASSNQVAAWFGDPRRQTHQIVFVDGRPEDDFKGGHIPGAWLFNVYEEEKYAATVVPVCQAVEVVVVYCESVDCDDSLSAAVKLRERGVPNAKLYVYAAGMAEWLTTGRPVETGPRDSGQYVKTAP